MINLNEDIEMAESYTADFETTTNKDDLRVWAWGVCNINNFDDMITILNHLLSGYIIMINVMYIFTI